MQQIVLDFRSSATRAVRAGFDAVEIHAAHGYLIHSFLSPLTNQRSDAYGGDASRRARLLREIVGGIRTDHPTLPILVRLSGDEWLAGGFDRTAAAQLTRWLADDGADLVDASSGGNVADAQIPVGPAYQTPIAHALAGTGIPIGTVGQVTSAEQAETILVTALADVVSIGRPALANPHLALGWAAELGAPDRERLIPGPLHRARF